MADESPSDRYIKFVIAHREATAIGNSRKANESYRKMLIALAEIRQSDDQGRKMLTAMLIHHHQGVRASAATHLLPFDESTAVQILESIASGSAGPDMVRFGAEMVLKEWHAGRLRVP